MKRYNQPLSFRTSKKIKYKLNKKVKDSDMNKSQFITDKIINEHKYVKQLQKFEKAYEIIDNITIILSNIILDENSRPYNEFYNDNILKSFYNVKCIADNTDFISPCFKTKYDGSKTEHISVRLDQKTLKKLDYITNFYNCKKSGIIPLLLQGNKDTCVISSLSECFCYITDINNYFYEKHINVPDFEKEYNLLWKTIS